MSGGATAVMAAAAVASAAIAYKNGQDANAAQNKAQKQAKATAQAQAKSAEEAANKADSKAPDTSAILSAATQAGKSGISSTMLTGASGVDPNAMSLGKTTLLGG